MSPSSPPLAMDGDGDGESAASEDNNDYLSRKRQKEQARERGGLYLLWGETYMTSTLGEGRGKPNVRREVVLDINPKF